MPVGNETPGAAWSAYIRAALDDHGWRPADLVRASGVKDNGRPVIDASRVSKWLDGQPPDYHLAVVAAEALGRPPAEALATAGYTADRARKAREARETHEAAPETHLREAAHALGVPDAVIDEYVRVALEDAAYLSRRAPRESAEDEARSLLNRDEDTATEAETDVTSQTRNRRRRRAS